MHICNVECNGKQYEVYGENGYLFSLYGKELKKYHIEADCEIADTLVDEICQSVIYKRARERALYLLERRPYSVSELRGKLTKNRYPESVREQVISFLEKYGYLDDVEYARMYMNTYISKRSYKQMSFELFRKGVSKDVIDTCIDELDVTEQDGFMRQFLRYTQGKDLGDYTVRQKVFRYFYGKGYPTSLIEEAVGRWREETEFYEDSTSN